MKRKLYSFLIFTGVISLAGCGGASLSPNSQNSSIDSVSVTCNPTNVSIGQSVQCAANVAGSGAYSSDVTWTTDAGTISSTGLLTTPSATPSSGTITVTATSSQNKQKYGHGALKFGNSTSSVSGVSVAANPSSITMGQTATCTATVSGSANYSTAVNWTATGGTITQAGVFTPSGPGSGTCTATSTQDGTKSGSATISTAATSTPVTVTGITVTANPSSITSDKTSTCVATVNGTGAYSTGVTWTATGGTITSGGVFTPSGTGTGICKATSTQTGYTTVAGSASITVTSSVAATLSLSSATLNFGNDPVGTPATLPVTLTSTGSSPVTVSAVNLTGTGFSFSGATFPVTLNPNVAVTIQVTFKPTTTGAASGTLAFSSNSSTGGSSVVNLSGNGTAVQHKVSLSWSAPANSPVGVTGYNIYRATGSSSSYQLLTSSSSTSYVDSSVQSSTAYAYYVTSVASGTESTPSNTVAVTVPN